VGVTKIHNQLQYKDKITKVDNVICIINGIFHGLYCVWQSRKRRCHDRQIDSGMVLEHLNCFALHLKKKTRAYWAGKLKFGGTDDGRKINALLFVQTILSVDSNSYLHQSQSHTSSKTHEL
jgi:hypothetical protein